MNGHDRLALVPWVTWALTLGPRLAALLVTGALLPVMASAMLLLLPVAFLSVCYLLAGWVTTGFQQHRPGRPAARRLSIAGLFFLSVPVLASLQTGPVPSTPPAIVFPAKIVGHLKSTDEPAPATQFRRGGGPSDRYAFTLKEEALLSVVMECDLGSATLLLLDSGGAAMNGGVGGDAALFIRRLPAGSYFIVATSDQGQIGPYTIQFSIASEPRSTVRKFDGVLWRGEGSELRTFPVTFRLGAETLAAFDHGSLQRSRASVAFRAITSLETSKPTASGPTNASLTVKSSGGTFTIKMNAAKLALLTADLEKVTGLRVQ